MNAQRSPIEIILSDLLNEQRKTNLILERIAAQTAAVGLGSTIPPQGDTEAVRDDNAHPGAKAKTQSRRKDG